MKKDDMRYYKKFCKGMILRDYLALDRTILANKRTLLAYIRTFIGFLASGIGMVELLAEKIINIIGYTFIIIAVPILIMGIIEYIFMKKALADISKNNIEKE